MSDVIFEMPAQMNGVIQRYILIEFGPIIRNLKLLWLRVEHSSDTGTECIACCYSEDSLTYF